MLFDRNSARLKGGKAITLTDVKTVLGQLKIAYVASSEVLINKMPMNNTVLKHASALDLQLKGIP